MNAPDIEKRLIAIRHELLFRLNKDGELTKENEPVEAEGEPPPTIHICYAKGEFCFKHRAGLSEVALKTIGQSLADLSLITNRPVEVVEKLVEDLKSQLLTDVELEHGPAFYIPMEVVHGQSVVTVTEANKDILIPHFRHTYLHIIDLQPCVAKVVDGRAVAACRTVRKTSAAVEAGVDTIEPFRRKGYGAYTVAAWASSVWSKGLVPCYSTISGNVASIGLARKLAMVQYATDFSIYFKEGERRA